MIGCLCVLQECELTDRLYSVVIRALSLSARSNHFVSSGTGLSPTNARREEEFFEDLSLEARGGYATGIASGYYSRNVSLAARVYERLEQSTLCKVPAFFKV